MWIVVCLSIHIRIHALFIIPAGKKPSFVLVFLLPSTEERIASENGNKINFIYGISLCYGWLSF